MDPSCGRILRESAGPLKAVSQQVVFWGQVPGAGGCSGKGVSKPRYAGWEVTTRDAVCRGFDEPELRGWDKNIDSCLLSVSDGCWAKQAIHKEACHHETV
ncbi:unnamed protein product [Protopolystoma xenopodis]|uniref:Uncharacterized protein n=1 Tax=Protopolystoma xenopodis TaxID=117903 RepID=A0A3S5CKR4_9PLAT|nr:unnamed protein product [Protopolystoma xenopodis]